VNFTRWRPLADALRDMRSWLAAFLEAREAAARRQAVLGATGFLETATGKEVQLGAKIALIEREDCRAGRAGAGPLQIRRVKEKIESLAPPADAPLSPSQELAQARMEGKRHQHWERIRGIESGVRRKDLEKALSESRQRLKDFLVFRPGAHLRKRLAMVETWSQRSNHRGSEGRVLYQRNHHDRNGYKNCERDILMNFPKESSSNCTGSIEAGKSLVSRKPTY
jgi:hypothetical protein